ncbi:MAG: UDP-N-acetylmuramyl-tripeptide synthetase [Myxococcales bacterium]|nr:UDP-N-acetylmuramyl-tripeptide synthetase [Myxococcales bacterium]
MIAGNERPVAPAFPWAAPWVSVGVTGTKGKSTTTALVAAALGADGHPVLSATTVGYAIGGAPAPRPADWDAFLALAEEAQRRGCRRAAIEVTSMALARGHARRWRFDVGVFTNLAEDHLHTHGSYEHYLASKAQLFIHLGPGRTAVLNAADPVSELLGQVIPADVERLWYASPSRGPALRSPALAPAAITSSLAGTRIALAPSRLAASLGGALEITMIGEVFAEDALAAAGAALAAGIPGELVRAGIAAAPPLPGRFEVVARAPIVVVDYAHTADALARVAADARRLVGEGRLIVVVGAGGGTDPGKRGPMGEAVGLVADRVIVTSDNPRDEDPRAIAAALAAGARRGGRAAVEVVIDRRAAIAAGLAGAGAGDLVLLAGKGHEATQTIGGRTILLGSGGRPRTPQARSRG